MKLKKILKDIPLKDVKGSKEIEITGLCANSKLVAPGNLFVAKRGRVEDGTQYIHEAVDAGAVAVLTDILDPSLKKVTQIIHPHVVDIEGQLAAHYYQFPSRQLFTVGITGTNGKTTTSFLVKHLLDQLEMPCGLIGTIEYIIGKNRYQATRTTPDVISNHKMLREMVTQGCKAAVMEVTSHALDQGRTQNIEFDIAIFTNLTLDHLDYHQTMENYCHAKQKLFKDLESKKASSNFPIAIMNADSPWTEKMLVDCKAHVLTYGLDIKARVRAKNIEFSSQGTRFTICYQGEQIKCESPLVGRFNIYNYLAAVCVGIARQEPLEKIVGILSSFSGIPGRMQRVNNDLHLNIFVDFAHTDDALSNVLECLQEFKKGRIITVFGCGGDRDSSKRPKMAKAAEELSDFSIVTSDNPRSENPESICQQITQGFRKNHWKVEVDRRKAIRLAIEMAHPEDIILIAGKGHEAYQIFAHKTIEFDDRKVAAQICSEKHHLALAGS
ncbi:MAG: UDP-N-acetylmuramoyl-L-alanyl-D-glutamate--2,6-diaminopimelate ligase [Chlamydiales bacterium 38-26]|nr:UDP-N-acetylmuramoyl-L-alanyl-D-glutamate--2,6-diaminopimelate ligase [Chlamydiales bacterium]OJV10854.1 MAG: UDP-N-acetylmuramoyl-L-alanyl-D-glutamate--2,6-diaminopimelate ligase [Chlamydiales bacterium 38-26]